MSGFKRARSSRFFARRILSTLPLLAALAGVGCAAPDANLELIDLEARIAELEAAAYDPSSIQGRIETLESGAEVTAAEVLAAQGLITTVQTDVDGAQAEIASAQAGITEAQAGLEAAQADISGVQTDIGAVEAEVVSAQAGIATMEIGLSSAQTDIALAQTGIASAQTDIASVQSTADLATTAAGEAIAAAAAAQSEVDSVEAELAVVDSELDAVDAAIAELPTAGIEFLPEDFDLAHGVPVVGAPVTMALPSEVLLAEALYLEVTFKTHSDVDGDDVEFMIRSTGSGPDRTQTCWGTHTQSDVVGEDWHTCHMWLPLDGTTTVEYEIDGLSSGTTISWLDIDIVAQLTE
jgi:hypothetical protein